VIFALLSLVLVVCLWRANESEDNAEPWGAFGVLVMLVLLFLLGVAAVHQLSFDADMAMLEQTRMAVVTVDCQNFSGSKILGDALEWNQQLASNLEWNRKWYMDAFIPDGWERVEPIRLLSCSQVDP